MAPQGEGHDGCVYNFPWLDPDPWAPFPLSRCCLAFEPFPPPMRLMLKNAWPAFPALLAGADMKELV